MYFFKLRIACQNILYEHLPIEAESVGCTGLQPRLVDPSYDKLGIKLFQVPPVRQYRVKKVMTVWGEFATRPDALLSQQSRADEAGR